MAAATLSRQAWAIDAAQSRGATVVAVAGLAIVFTFFFQAYQVPVFLILMIVFIIIACGNSLGGILTNSGALLLGEISYSIYLLHGIILFLLMHHIFTVDEAAALSVVQHWSILTLAAPFLICLSFATFLLIENPSMALVPHLATWLRRQTTAVSATHAYDTLAELCGRYARRAGLT